MFLRYNGKTPDFKYKGFDFSKGPCEVPDKEAAQLIEENPYSFTPVVKAEKEVKEDKEEKPKKTAAK